MAMQRFSLLVCGLCSAFIACTLLVDTEGLSTPSATHEAAPPDGSTTSGPDGSTIAPSDASSINGPDASIDAPDAEANAGTDASDAYPGVSCGATSTCTAPQGCCLDAGVCGTVLDCLHNYIQCDGTEDCAGAKRCCAVTSDVASGTVCSEACGNYICHTSAECPNDFPICCPYPNDPRLSRCRTSCP